MSRWHRKLIRDRRRWERTRRIVFERDGYRCVLCGKHGRLECDHVTPLRVDPNQDVYDPSGCRTTCRACNTARNRRPDPEGDAWRRLLEGLFTSS